MTILFKQHQLVLDEYN